MIAMTLGEIAALVGGRIDPSAEHVVVTGDAFLDSRSPVAGGLFVAVPGEHVDGTDFAEPAVAGGAAGVLSARDVAVPAVVVDDVVAALGVLARHVVGRLPELTVVGLTGSQGKTSTKDMLAEILGADAPTVAPRESLNNEIGLPLTALRVAADTRYLVAEMGARGMGHIAYLADIVKPSVGLVLNVGVAHIGEFGSQDGIAAAKGELVEGLPATGLAVLNADDPRVLAMAARTAAPVLTFGTTEQADVRLSRVDLDDVGHTVLRISWHDHTADLTLRYVGAHHAANAAAAVAVAVGLGIEFDAATAALREASPLSKWRMEVTQSPDGYVVINDAYNANPDSVRAALDALVDIARRRGDGRTVAVLGEMLELGDTSRDEHESAGRYAVELGLDRILAVGEGARPLYKAASLEGPPIGTTGFASDADEALRLLRGELLPGDVVLVKASRATGLEDLAASLLEGLGHASAEDGER